MATGLLHSAASAVSAVSLILLCFYPSAISAAAIRARQIPPWFDSDPVPADTATQPKPTTTIPSNGVDHFIDIHSETSNNGNQEPVGGFHLKLDADIIVDAALSAQFKSFSMVDREFFIDENNSGFDDINGIFRPSNGLYLLSALVHISAASQPITQENDKAETTTTALSDKPSRVTVAFCVNNTCGSKAILKSYSAISSSGDLDTISVSGVLSLKQGQEITLNVENHSNDRQIVISEQSTLNAYLLKAQ